MACRNISPNTMPSFKSRHIDVWLKHSDPTDSQCERRVVAHACYTCMSDSNSLCSILTGISGSWSGLAYRQQPWAASSHRSMIRVGEIDGGGWARLVAEPNIKRKFFTALQADYQNVLGLNDSRAADELKQRGLEDVMLAYINFPTATKRSIFRFANLSLETLKCLKAACSSMSGDLEEAIKYRLHGKTVTAARVGKRAPLQVRKRKGAPVDAERRKTIEAIVEKLKSHGKETNAVIAKICFPDSRIEGHCAETDMVQEAKRLAQYRDGTEVVYHSDPVQNRGRRPKRK